MNEERFNGDVRKFLKKFGISAQREIEIAVQQGLKNGSLKGDETLKVRARLDVEGLETDLLIEEEVRLS